ELLERNSDAGVQWLEENPPHHPRLYPFQLDANRAVDDAFIKRKRLMLVAMATGTGKTFTTVNEVYRLLKSGCARRVLFLCESRRFRLLVHQRALAAQAARVSSSFEPESGLKFDRIYEVYSQRFFRDDIDPDDQFDPTVLPTSYLTKPETDKTFVYVSTIQRM